MNIILSTLIFLVFLSTSNSTYSHVSYDREKEFFTILVRTTTDTLELYKLVNKSWEFRTTNLDSAFYYSDLGLELLNKFTHKKLESELLDNRSLLLQIKGNLDSAELLQLKALVIRTGINDYKGLISSYNGLGNINKELGKFKTALFYFSKALSFVDSLNYQHINGINEKQSISIRIEESIEEINLLNGNRKEDNKLTSYANYIDFDAPERRSQVVASSEKDINYYIIGALLFLVFSYITFHFYKSN